MICRDGITVTDEDLLKQDVDAIVNPANTHLMLGAGVAGLIHKFGGPEIVKECALRRPIPVGGAVATTAGELPFRKVIHAVGPIWGGGQMHEPGLLRLAHENALTCAAMANVSSVAFPAISCGVFGYPVRMAAPVAIDAVRSWMRVNPGAVDDVRFCMIDPAYYKAFAAALEAEQ